MRSMHNSIWNNLLQMPHFPRLDQDLRTDVLIIGGGMTGILCGHRLQQVEDDYLHGSIHDPQRSGVREGESLCGCVFALAYRTQTAAVSQWIKSSSESADAHQTALSPHGMCPEMESAGA